MGSVTETRISRTFARLRSEGKRGLIAYITAGDPSPDETTEFVLALARGGADVIELGIPFSDPIADGPVIQRASERALRAHMNVPKLLEIAAEIRRRSQVPLLLFSYLNPLMRYGLGALAADAAKAGVDGCLMTDLSVEDALPYVKAMQAHGLDTVFLAAPTSTPRRLELVARYSTGFVYLVSRTGVTGERASLSSSVKPLVEAMRRITPLPLAVGFGISTPEHMAEVGRVADAAVVGSAFVRMIEENPQNVSLPIQLECFARELKRGFQLNQG
jgi:tryptophan synthase alpha chain